MKDTVTLLKKRLRTHGYGNYDLLIDLFSETDLLYKKPGTLYFILLELVEDDTIGLNRKSFYSWLSRYRKRHKRSTTAESEKSWKNSTPSDLKTVTPQPESLIFEIVKPKKT